MKRVVILLGIMVLFTVSCIKNELESQVSKVSFTPCQQSNLRSSELSNKVDVKFTDKGVQITYYNFEVTCDFTDVNVTHTLKNGVLNITQQGAPNLANCICQTDISYTIAGILQNDVNVIFINGVQVYCHNENFPIKIPYENYSLAGTPCKWTNLNNNNEVIIINQQFVQNTNN